MKTAATLLITWATATLLLLWLADFNMYLVYPNGTRWVKEQASFGERVGFSMLVAAFYSLVNTSLLWLWQRLCKRVSGPVPAGSPAGP